MATNLKSNNIGMRLLAVFFVAALTAGLLLLTRPVYTASQRNVTPLPDTVTFIEELDGYSYALNWKLRQQQQGPALTPMQLYYPALYQPGAAPEAADERALFDEELARFEETSNDAVNGWYNEFINKMGNHDYLVRDEVTGDTLGSLSPALLRLAGGDTDSELEKELQADYQFYGVLRFDDKGSLSVPSWYGGRDKAYLNLGALDLTANLQSRVEGISSVVEAMGTPARPQSLTIVFTLPVQLELGEHQYYEYNRLKLHAFLETGFELYYWACLVLAALLGLVYGLVRRWNMGETLSAKLPPEVAVAVFFFVTWMRTAVCEAVYTLVSGLLIEDYTGRGVSPLLAFFPAGIGAALMIYALLWLSYAWALSLTQAYTMGPLRWLRERSLLAKLLRALHRGILRLVHSIRGLDLQDKSNRRLMVILLANFVLLSVISCFWVFGIALLVVYTLALFYGLRRSQNRLRHQFSRLLEATHEIGAGRLDAQIEEDLGVFEPLKAELAQVQTGFQRAVEAEGRSQAMKTELITNVSHDLKTPLTAIITYIDLLKQEGLSEEERRSYVATLDKKAQRLKVLIQDLFDMSKASSRDIQLEYASINLPGLIQQVALDCRDELAEADIELRVQCPEECPALRLDGEKTSRIFENLFSNIAKYGQPGTRAFAMVRPEGEGLRVEVKNTSRDALDFEGRDITERFVRGDRSRNTEGSGLGLAIAKSFTELQGGRFSIAADGDLFKAILFFPLAEEGRRRIATPPGAVEEAGE